MRMKTVMDTVAEPELPYAIIQEQVIQLTTLIAMIL